jgi:hypothetical protein
LLLGLATQRTAGLSCDKMIAEYTHDEYYMLVVSVLIEMILMYVMIHLMYSTQGTDTPK